MLLGINIIISYLMCVYIHDIITNRYYIISNSHIYKHHYILFVKDPIQKQSQMPDTELAGKLALMYFLFLKLLFSFLSK